MLFTDRCFNGRGGGFFDGDSFYWYWEGDLPLVFKLHVNSKDVLTVFLASAAGLLIGKTNGL